VTQPFTGGAPCPAELSQTQSCKSVGYNLNECPVHCDVGTYGGWSACSVTCGGGTQSRTRSHVAPKHGGIACPATAESQSCNTTPCTQLCSHTTCTYAHKDGAWRTTIQHTCGLEQHGTNFKCKYHFAPQTITANGKTTRHHQDCACYCDYSGLSELTHTHTATGPQTDIKQLDGSSQRVVTRGIGGMAAMCAKTNVAVKK